MERAIQEIGVFLSSSVDEFQMERRELGEFIRFLNEHIYKPRKIHLDWRVCENESSVITPGRYQDDFNAQIRNCRFFFLLIGRHIGQYTREEFDIALSLFNASKDRPEAEARDIPKIFPFFKELPYEDRTAEARAFREYLHKDVNGGQYSLVYNHIDTLKLQMLTEFGRDIVLGGKVTVEDETVRMDGQSVMGVGKIPAYANHRNLKRLRRQKAKLDAEFAELSLRYHAGDTDAGKERLLVSQERNELSDRIHAIESAVLDMFNLATEMAREHQTERAEEAARLLEAGEYEQAQMVLQSIDSPEIQADWRKVEQMAAAGLELVRALIQENRLRMQTLLAQGVNTETLPQLEACYKQNADVAQHYHMEPQAVFDYAVFLWQQTDYPRAIALCEWLEMEYQMTDVQSEAWAHLWNLLGICHSKNNNFQQGETYFHAALEYYRTLAKANPASFVTDVALTYNNLAALLRQKRQHMEAEALYREALASIRAFAEDNPSACYQYVAMICNNLANLLDDTKKYEESEMLFREALEIRRALAVAYPAAFTVDVAITCHNLARLLSNTGRYAEAEVLYREALKILHPFAKTNPFAFGKHVADSCDDFASLLDKTGRHEEAKMLHLEALELYQSLAAVYPNTFAPDLADAYFNLGAFELNNHQNLNLAKEYFQKALSIFEHFPHLAHYAVETRKILQTLF